MSRRSVRPLGPLAWIGAPLALCVVATIVLGTPIRVFGMRLPEPVFPMVLAFAWPVIRPSLLAPFGVLAAGLFLDLFWSAPLGLWPICLLLAYAAALIARSLMAGRSARVLLVWYLALTGVAFLAAYLVVMLRAHVTPNLTATLFQLAATVVLFPLVIRLIDRFEDTDIRVR